MPPVISVMEQALAGAGTGEECVEVLRRGWRFRWALSRQPFSPPGDFAR